LTTFRLKNDRLLEVALENEKVMARAGAMVAYDGSIKFEKALLGGEGLLGALKRTVTKESFELMSANGSGTVYFAQQAREITILPLAGETMFIESRSILAFDRGLKTNVAFAGLRGATSGQGLFTTTVEGQGHVAVISDGNILMLEVNPSLPLFVDPDAFIGYKGTIRQEFVFDVNWKTMIGETSGESYQLKFTGSGIVYIQPSERK
jgi:uncharacterized protein (AIM24 family)